LELEFPLSRYPPLDHPAGDFPRVVAYGGDCADEPFISVIGGLLPMALDREIEYQLPLFYGRLGDIENAQTSNAKALGLIRKI